MENPHNLDPTKDYCMDCGASQQAINDNLFPTCERFTGPHQFAMRAVYGALVRARSNGRSYQRVIEEFAPAEGSEGFACLEGQVRDAKEREAQLYNSLELLRRESGMYTERRLSVAAAIRRL